jgi:hypothetical protein
MGLRRAVLAVAATLAGCAGAQHLWSRQSLCELEREQDGPVRSHETWLALLLRGYDPATHRATTPAIDCTNVQVRWEGPVVTCFDGALSKTLLPDRPLGEKDVVATPLGDDIQLVWVQTSRFASGDALGPVAIVEMKPRRLIVRAIGVLRGYSTRARLRLEKLGGTEVLVAEGESCTSEDPASCQRAARVVPLRGERFATEPLVSTVGACVSAAWFDLAREEIEPLESGWKRRFRLDAALTFESDTLRIQEQLAIHDLDPHKPLAPPRLFRRAQGERTVQLLDGSMVAAGKPLWTKVVMKKADE